jgi:hypothetical protein
VRRRDLIVWLSNSLLGRVMAVPLQRRADDADDVTLIASVATNSSLLCEGVPRDLIASGSGRVARNDPWIATAMDTASAHQKRHLYG